MLASNVESGGVGKCAQGLRAFFDSGGTMSKDFRMGQLLARRARLVSARHAARRLLAEVVAYARRLQRRHQPTQRRRAQLRCAGLAHWLPWFEPRVRWFWRIRRVRAAKRRLWPGSEHTDDGHTIRRHS